MNNWKLFNGNDYEWEKLTLKQVDSSYFHDNQWANHFKNLGWEPCRWQYQYGDKNIAFLQGFLKRYPFGIGVLWFPDWIIGDFSLNNDLIKVIKKSLGLKLVTIRIRSHRQKNEQDLELLEQFFYRPKKPFGSPFKMQLNFSSKKEIDDQRLSKNWRRNLKRSKKLSYEIVEIHDTRTIAKLYNSMSETKKLKKVFFSENQIKSLLSSHKNNILVIGARTPNGEIHTIRGAIIRGKVGIDIFAATNAFSRKHYLSYAICWELLQRLKSLGCTSFDFSGVDPENNTGVYNFKKGTGAELIETLGEFEYSSNYLMKKLVEIASRWKD